MKNIFNVIIVILLGIFLFGFILFLIELEEFHQDYMCTTINDFEYYEKHNCSRFK